MFKQRQYEGINFSIAANSDATYYYNCADMKAANGKRMYLERISAYGEKEITIDQIRNKSTGHVLVKNIPLPMLYDENTGLGKKILEFVEDVGELEIIASNSDSAANILYLAFNFVEVEK